MLTPAAIANARCSQPTSTRPARNCRLNVSMLFTTLYLLTLTTKIWVDSTNVKVYLITKFYVLKTNRSTG